MPNIPGFLLSATTPKTIEKYTSNSQGSVVGWEMSPNCMLFNRLGHITPIHNLFLVGHWTNPGGGIASSALSGYIMANYIINEKKGLMIERKIK